MTRMCKLVGNSFLQTRLAIVPGVADKSHGRCVPIVRDIAKLARALFWLTNLFDCPTNAARDVSGVGGNDFVKPD
jgi:hypothetical protein